MILGNDMRQNDIVVTRNLGRAQQPGHPDLGARVS